MYDEWCFFMATCVYGSVPIGLYLHAARHICEVDVHTRKYADIVLLICRCLQ